ncbi:MAG TPA: metalloregulator ArsR/SmtB family transcription factor [Phycisphaerales bacterium]
MPAASPISTLAEPRRQELVRLLWNAERTAGDLAAHMPVSFSAVSQHLAVLLDAGLVERRRDGRRQIYALNKPALGPLAVALEQMWFGALTTLKDMAEAEERRASASPHPDSNPNPHSARRSKPITPRPTKKGLK